MEFWKGKKVVVLGAGRSGIGAVKLLRFAGAVPFLSDSGYPQLDEDDLKFLERESIEFEFGTHSERIDNAELAVLSPGISGNSPVVTKLIRKNIRIISEVELAWRFVSEPVVAITGSNGKTTTTSLIGHLLEDTVYTPVICGNIGNSFSEAVVRNLKSGKQRLVYVLEVSSFQLERITSFKPFISVILNLSPDHLDRYESMDEYVEAKLRIMHYQDDHDWCVYNADDKLLSEKLECQATLVPFGFEKSPDQRFWFDGKNVRNGNDEVLFSVDSLKIKGLHNIANGLAALTVCSLLGIKDEHLKRKAPEFSPVPHRLEFVEEINAVKYYNDSKATNLDSVLIAIRSFNEPKILVMGGKDKGADFTRLLPELSGIREIILIGQASEKIEKALRSKKSCLKAATLEEAVQLANRVAHPGDVVLLSPACSSFDMFTNFEERGEIFKNAVKKLKDEILC